MNIREAYQIMQEASGIEVGDKVKVLRANIKNELGSNTAYHTKEELDRRGREGKVSKVDKDCIIVNTTSDCMYWIPFFVLEIIEKAEVKKAKDEKMVNIRGKDYSESTIQKALQEYVQ